MSFVNEISNQVSNLSTADLYVIAGALASAIIWAINNIKVLHKSQPAVLSFVVPFGGALIDGVFNSGSQFFVKGTLLYALSQLVYYTAKAVIALATKGSAQPAAGQF